RRRNGCRCDERAHGDRGSGTARAFVMRTGRRRRDPLGVRAFGTVLARDLRLARRQGGDAGLAVLFFILGTVLVPLGIGPEGALLSRIGAGLLWVMALLAALLS